MSPPAVTSRDLVSLARRMGYLQLFRLGLVGVVLISAAAMPSVVGSSFLALAPVSAAYGGLSALAEWLRRAGGRRSLGALALMLLVDGVFLAWVMHLTGGLESPLLFLLYAHVVAVSLSVSYRSGLKLALWHSLLLVATHEAQAAGVLPGSTERLPRLAAFRITALWMVAIVTALFSALNERELRRRRRDLETLAEMASEMENVNTPAEVAGVLLTRVTETFGFRRGVVLGLHDRAATILAGVGESPADPARRMDAALRKAWRGRQPVLVRSLDWKQDPWLRRVLPDAVNVAIFPMMAEGQAIGALVVERGGLPRVERRMIAAAEQFASHAALSLRNAWLMGRVQELAERDPLTGACNRRTFERDLGRALAHSERAGEPMSLAMFDIDHFKKINDRSGHQAGDDVLRRVAEALDSASRSFDTVARYGGEEFSVIMPGLPAAEALSAVERLRAAIAAGQDGIRVTASAGVAAYPVNARDAESLIRYADEALYASKAKGRNRSTRSRRRGGQSAQRAERAMTR